MKKAKGTSRFALPAALIAASVLAYPWVIDRCAFYPERHTMPPAEQLPAGIQEHFIATEDGEQLYCYWLPRPPSTRAIAYFHGNAGHIGHRIPNLTRLADMGFNVMGVGYRGFGKSSGRPSERGIYRDGRAVLDDLVNAQGFHTSQIILMGISIGSTVAVEIAEDTPVGAVVLVTPLTTGKAVAKANGYDVLSVFAGNMFDNLSRIDRIRSPLLIIHGTADEIIPVEMGRQLYEKANQPKQMIIIEGAHHNDIASFAPDLFWGALQNFFASLNAAE